MRALPVIRTFPLVVFLVACVFRTALHGQSHDNPATNGTFVWMEKKWAEVSDGDLLKASDANNPEAEFFYWRREYYKARQQQNQLSFRWQSSKNPDDLKNSNAAADHAAKLFSLLEKSADQGFVPAEGEAAMFYLQLAGYAVTQVNLAKGVDLMRKSADGGWNRAQYQLANIYLQGQLLPPDLAKAVKYFQEAADQGGPNSQYELARLYANGYGTPRGENDTPIALLRKSAESNNVTSLHELGERYRLGISVPLDYVQAAYYYEKTWRVSDNGGHDPDRTGNAIFALVDTDLAPKPGLRRELSPFAKVVSTRLKASQRHDGAAMSQIAQWYVDGRFVPLDLAEAYRWFHLAADVGAPNARTRQEEIRAKLSPAQLKRALIPLQL
jgi:TPR repeat protein